MESSLSLSFFCVLLIASVESNILKKVLTIDKEHLKLDFGKLFGIGSWTDMFSDAEMDFRYFVAHDRDNNKKLDGLELLMALEHDAKHEELAHDGQPANLEELQMEVEAIFSDHDKDGDGYLNYKEFMTVHKTRPDISGERKVKKPNQEL